MEDERITYEIQTYERHLSSKLCVCSTTFGRATLGANGLPKLILAFLFSDHQRWRAVLEGSGANAIPPLSRAPHEHVTKHAVVSCTSSRMTLRRHSCCSARHPPLKFRTTVPPWEFLSSVWA